MQPILLALVVAAATVVKIDVRTPKANVLPGEPIKLVLRWHAPPDAEVTLEDDNEGLRRFLEVWVDDGGGFRRFCEAARHPVEGITVRRLPSRPRPYVQNIALVGGEYNSDCSGPARKSFVFPKPGRYRLKLTYPSSPKSAGASSNVLTFEVRPPKGEEEDAILGMIRHAPWLLLTGGEKGKRTLLDRHPESPYFSYAKISAHWAWEAALSNREDPDTGQSLWHLSQDEYERFVKDQRRRKAQELLAEREWGAFDEERLGHALSAAKRSGDTDAAVRIRAETMTRFGDSQLVQRLREDEAADEEDEDDDEESPVKKPSPAPNR